MIHTTTGRIHAALVAQSESTRPVDPVAQPLTRRELRERRERQDRPPRGPLKALLATQTPSISSLTRRITPVPPVLAISAPGRGAARGSARGSRWSRATRSLTSMGAMAGVAAMLVSTSISAGDFARPDVAAATQAGMLGDAPERDVQSLAVVPPAAAAAPVLARDAYTAQSVAQQVQAKYGNRVFAYSNNPAGTIQWPFAIPSPISYGYGPRVACSYCSSFHLGVDFTPGAGTPIQSIADGVVSAVITDQGGLGSHVIVDHLVNGQRVQSVYAHMAWGSIQVATGRAITVGTIIGEVGSTGTSTGAHLHLEIHADGTPIDPFEWLKANAN